MNPVTKHVPQSAQIVMRWRGWYLAPQIYYVCSCGRRLKKYGEHTITHFQPDIVGYAAVCRQLDALQAEAEAADAARQATREKEPPPCPATRPTPAASVAA